METRRENDAIWAAKYPFTDEARKFISLKTPPLEEFGSDDLKYVLERAFERAVNAVYGKIEVEWRVGEEEYLVATSFPLALAIVKATKNPFIYMRFAVGESKRAEKLLRNEPRPENVVYVAKQLNLNVKYLGEGFYQIHFMDYLKIASRIASPSWKLVNNTLRKGYVKINQRKVSRIISEKVRDYILEKLTEDVEMADENLTKLSQRLLNLFGRRKAEFEVKKELVDKNIEDFPPCMKKIYERVVEGGNPPHTARFALTTFLLGAGFKIDEVFKLFAATADFNEKIAKYQIEHIAGERGGRKKYKVPSCEKMKLYGLCTPNAYCRSIKNPITYLLIKKRLGRRSI